ncbi:hypothetical protein M8C21_015801 [Ambrosia artemisiifolia]|uniref:Uncharacterized protein n=1 Tax=Ambrosia artemisiifolia TaxID=4212 RepID=A0AAD5D5C5_AMBAR|nr:hypothetical protein M8C21_015801 [Ambrosia artemisiifolia]
MANVRLFKIKNIYGVPCTFSFGFKSIHICHSAADSDAGAMLTRNPHKRVKIKIRSPQKSKFFHPLFTGIQTDTVDGARQFLTDVQPTFVSLKNT